MKHIPRIFVVRQLGGACHSWTVCVTILRSVDWKTHIPDVPLAGEDPPPTDGIPHPLRSEGLTAEQLYQNQLANWLIQNAAPPPQGPVNQAQPPPAAEIQINGGWGHWPAPLAPPAPPALINYQQRLATEGL